MTRDQGVQVLKKYNVTFLIGQIDEAFWAFVPEHRAYINQLMSKDVILTYSVNAERSRGWMTVRAKNHEDVLKLLEKSPITTYLSYEIDELFIYDNPALLFPKVSLN
jgi:hypothetical protein